MPKVEPISSVLKALISFSVIVSSTLVATKGDRLLSASLVLEVSPSSSTIA